MKGPQNPKEQDQSKEDHLAPTPIEEYNKTPVKGPEKSENLSHSETQKRFEVYGRIGDLMQGYNVAQDIKEKYQNEMNEVKQVRTQSDVHYGQGIRSGLPHQSYEALQHDREAQDQKFRNEVNKEIDARYEEGDNLRKKFREEQPSPNELRQQFREMKDKGMDREK